MSHVLRLDRDLFGDDLGDGGDIAHVHGRHNCLLGLHIIVDIGVMDSRDDLGMSG